MEKDDITPVKSKRDELNERLKSKYPDKDFSNDDVFYGQIGEDFDNLNNELGGYKEREKAFSDMFTSDPRSASFITSWRNGEDPTISLIRRFGPEIKEAIDDPEMQDKIAEANKEYVSRVEKSKQLEAEYNKNIAETLDTIQKMSEEGKLLESQIDDAFELLIKIVHDGIVGKFSKETINMAIKALNHDTDVEEADRAGEVRGRNAKIDEKLRRANKGDGTAQLDGRNNLGGAGKAMHRLGALDKYEDGNQNIWERGGEKRTRAPRE